nr:hypothetical protein CFP56_13341 [Quercus suber]
MTDKEKLQVYPEEGMTFLQVLEEDHAEALEEVNDEEEKEPQDEMSLLIARVREHLLWRFLIRTERRENNKVTVATAIRVDSSEEESQTESEDDEIVEGRLITFGETTPEPIRQMLIYLSRQSQNIFPEVNGQRLLNAAEFDTMLGQFRKMVWQHPQVMVPINLYNAVKDMPPIGAVFQTDGSYECGNGIIVPRFMRLAIQGLKTRFAEEQERMILERDEKQNEQVQNDIRQKWRDNDERHRREYQRKYKQGKA